MADLISILILFYSVQGVEMESEMPLAAAQCEAAEKAIAAAISTKKGPNVEMMNGRRVPVAAVRCLHACTTTDGLPDLESLPVEAAHQNHQADGPLIN